MVLRTIAAAACLAWAMLAAPRGAAAVEPGRVLTWPGGGKGEVRFEGKEHAKEGYGCKDCHPGLFGMKHGTAAMTMAAMDGGRFCGACHNGTRTFSTRDPKKCHECHRGSKREKHEKHESRKHKEHD